MKETYYFSHDYGARNDEKIVKLLSKEGWEGYGIYWAIIEKLYEADGWIVKDYDAIAFDMRTDSERIKRIIEGYNLFVGKEKIYSNSVLARLRKRKGKSEQARQSANLRWNKPKLGDANALRTQSEGNAIKNSKVKEKKVNIMQPPAAEETKPPKYTPSEIQAVMDIFYKINPALPFGNKTQRKAVTEMFDLWGQEKTAKMAEYAISLFGVAFAPTITTPYQLKLKSAELAGHWQKKSKPNVTII